MIKSSAAIARDVEPIPALREHPSKLFVETTSRCNLNCVMCMKQNGGVVPTAICKIGRAHV